MSRGAATRRLDWIEVGRGAAALGVVLSHYDPFNHDGPLFFIRAFGGWGVEFFFCLSGFIIFYVHGRELGEPRAIGRYLWRRGCRILPTYWIVLIAALIFNQTLQNPAVRLDLSPGLLVRQFLLWPDTDLVIGPGWTLRHELLFYGVFALCILSRRAGLSLFALWMGACLSHLLIDGPPPGQIWTPMGIVLHHYNLDFALGMGIAWATRAGHVERLAKPAALLAIALVAIRVAGLAPGIVYLLVSLKLIFAAILMGLILLSRRGVSAPKAGVTLGAASYALYISHILIGIFVSGGLKHLQLRAAIPPLVLFAGQTAAAVMVALLLFRYVENPLLQRLYAIWDGRSKPRSVPGGSIAADQGV